MCLTEPVRVIAVDGAIATVEANGRHKAVSALAVPEVRPGDWAILAAGLLVRVVEPAAAEQISAALRVATEELSEPSAPMKGDRQ
jgi:hydrogenase assembly chaperone HypC/HupF